MKKEEVKVGSVVYIGESPVRVLAPAFKDDRCVVAHESCDYDCEGWERTENAYFEAPYYLLTENPCNLVQIAERAIREEESKLANKKKELEQEIFDIIRQKQDAEEKREKIRARLKKMIELEDVFEIIERFNNKEPIFFSYFAPERYVVGQVRDFSKFSFDVEFKDGKLVVQFYYKPNYDSQRVVCFKTEKEAQDYCSKQAYETIIRDSQYVSTKRIIEFIKSDDYKVIDQSQKNRIQVALKTAISREQDVIRNKTTEQKDSQRNLDEKQAQVSKASDFLASLTKGE